MNIILIKHLKIRVLILCLYVEYILFVFVLVSFVFNIYV